MNIKKIMASKGIVLVVFILVGTLGHLLFSASYNSVYPPSHIKCGTPYIRTLTGWWALIICAYLFYLLIRFISSAIKTIRAKEKISIKLNKTISIALMIIVIWFFCVLFRYEFYSLFDLFKGLGRLGR